MPDENPKPEQSSKLAQAMSAQFGAAGGRGSSNQTTPRVVAQLRRTELPPKTAQTFWSVIRNRTIDFNQYKGFMDDVMCCVCDPLPRLEDRLRLEKEGRYKKENALDLRLPFPGVRAYSLLKLATELYLMQECGICCFKTLGYNKKTEGPCVEGHEEFEDRFKPSEEAERMGRDPQDVSAEKVLTELGCKDRNTDRERYLELLENEVAGTPDTWVLPYFKTIREKLKEVPLKDGDTYPLNCYGILRTKLTDPCLLELIWSYWHEEGMLVQTMNAITRRFQNLRSTGATDPLANLEIDPLRPLNNLIWGHIQDEQHRLSITRRVYEYDHHYGLRLVGKAIPELRPADSRSKFLEGFHNLLHACTIFFQQDDDTTVIADGFPLLNALREVHLTLAQGAHNQFGDLPWTSRIEMLMEMWLLARPEIREFLRGRIMVPYPEPWMDAVDHMKKIQTWTDTSVREFRDLGVFGEQLLLSIRYDNWGSYNDANIAASWARYWRQEIQRYIHAYRAVTGVDLSQEPVNSTMPAVLLQRRLGAQAAATR